MKFLIIFPIVLLFFSWSAVLHERKRGRISRVVWGLLILQTASTAVSFVGLCFSLLSPALFALFFALALFCGIWDWKNKRTYNRCAAHTEGKVVDLIVRQRTHYPIIRFEVAGKFYTAKSNVSCSRGELGKDCWVKYNPDDPQEIVQEQYGGMGQKIPRIISIVALVFALFFLPFAIGELLSLWPSV